MAWVFTAKVTKRLLGSDAHARPFVPRPLVCRPAKGPAVEGGRIDAFDIGRSHVELLPTVHE